MGKKREKRIKCEKMLKWWKKGEFGLQSYKSRMKFPPFPPFPLICPRASKKGENEKNVNIMLKWWNKRIKCEKMPKWWKKGKKRNKWEKRGKNE